MSRKSAFVLVVFLSVICSFSWADEPPLITDRPDFTESSVVVPKGSVQLEAGITWAQLGEYADHSFSGPEVLIRWAISQRIELRFGLPDYLEVREGGQKHTAWTDSSVGFKWELGKSTSPWNFALIGMLTLPTGNVDLTANVIDPDAIFTVARDLSDRWSFGAQIGAGQETFECQECGNDQTVGFVAGTVVLGLAAGDRTGAFFELAAEEVEDVDTFVQFHHGWTYSLSPTLQLDVHGALGLNDNGPDWLIGAGFAKRF